MAKRKAPPKRGKFRISDSVGSVRHPESAAPYPGATRRASRMQAPLSTSSTGKTCYPLKRPPKTPDRAYPLVKNQEYAYAYD
jgi:hypothetical protein